MRLTPALASGRLTRILHANPDPQANQRWIGVMPAIPANLPPMFLAWAQDDGVALHLVVKFHDALAAAGHKPEVHIFSAGGHGLGLRKQGTSSDHWIDAFYYWLDPGIDEDILALVEPFNRALTTSTTIRGLPVVVHNTRPDIATQDVLHRLDQSLGLIERYAPHHLRRARRDFSRILVQRYACRGAYLPDQHACLVELTFTVNREFSESQIAATILHEAMHARLHRMGVSLEMADRARQERFCRRAEIEFGLAVPDGAPIVKRALATLEAPDEDVAPNIDPALAARRVAQADLEALGAQRRGLVD